MMKRRDALKTMGALAGAATMGKFLPGCGTDDDGPVGITTFVVLLMENRSYDHLFGARSLEGLGGDGLIATMSNPGRNGGPAVTVYEAGGGDATCVEDPPHDWEGSHAQFNAGAMDGFLAVHQERHGSDLLTAPMQYLTRSHVPFSWAVADNYVSCDRYFCSVMGPTWPNRMYWHAGTSKGILQNELPTSGGFDDWTSIYHNLVAKEIEYGYYYGDVPVLSVIGDTIPGNTDRVFRMEDFFLHARNGTLPPVVYIDPAFSGNDDHPPHHPILGQQLIASIYAALAASPQWKNCMFLVSYDENGGFYDHVAPPAGRSDEYAAAGFDQLGFRVPTMVMGPYVKKGAVVSTQYDHTSVLKHIENMFALDPLSMRSTQAVDLSDCLDMERLARGEWEPAAQMPAIEVDESAITAACTGAAEFHHDMLDWADTNAGQIGKLDRRGQVKDYLFTIGDYLESMNAGRIRRGH